MTHRSDFGAISGKLPGESLILTADQLAGTVRLMTAEEQSWAYANKPKDRVIPTPVASESRRRMGIADRLAGLDAASEVRLIVASHDDGADDWEAIGLEVARNGAEKSTLLAKRQAGVALRMEPVRSLARRKGWHTNADFWIATASSFQLSAADALVALGELDEAFEITLDVQEGELLALFRGGEIRTGTRANVLVSSGYDGNQGHGYGGTGKGRLAIYEPYASLLKNHVGFVTGIFSRWSGINTCGTGSCTGWTPFFDGTLNYFESRHATATSAAAFGSIEGGSDPAVPGAADRIDRSGMASKAAPYFYTGGFGDTPRIAALQHATGTTLIDTLNMSYSDSGSCNNLGGVSSADKQALYNAAAFGVLVTASSGNSCPLGTACNTCTVGWPAVSRAGLTVGALQTDPTGAAYNSTTIMKSDPSSPPVAGDGTLPGQGSYGTARGGQDVTIHGTTYAGVVSLIDLAAPGCRDMLPDAAGANNNYNFGACGTSLAAPITAGASTLFAHWASASGWAPTSRQRQAAAIVTADGWSFASGGKPTSGFDLRSGAGRMKTHALGYPSMSGPWGYTCVSGTVGPSQVVSYDIGGSSGPEPSTIQTWKAALTWAERDFSDAADIDLKLVDTCPSGGGTTTLGSDLSRDLRARLRLTSATVASKCLQAQVMGYWVPAGEVRYFSLCSYYQSDNQTEHLSA